MIQTSEWVSPGHSDKVADFISSYILDRYIEQDPKTRFALEVQIKDNFVSLAGEVTSQVNFPPERIADFVREAVNKIGYTAQYQRQWGPENTICGNDIEVVQHIGQQSPDIAQGVNADGWGDQGIFHGMAVNSPDTDYMPKDWWLARKIGMHLYETRYAGIDIKTQVTLTDGKIDEIVVAIPMTHRHFTSDVEAAVAYCCGGSRDYRVFVNGTGAYKKHGPVGDAGTTGRKLAVDFYGGNCKIGGGCVDGETEYLSPDGWRKIKDYDGGLVGQIDDQMRLSFVKPEHYIQTWSDDVYDISMESTLSMVLSGNHNVYYRTSKGNYRKKSLSEILLDSVNSTNGSHVEIPRFFTYDFAGGVAKYSDAMARLIVAHCADGCVTYGTRCRISVKRERKIERLRWLFQEAGIACEEKKYDDGFTRFYYNLENPSKLLSEHFANPDFKTACLLADETLLWDGSEHAGEYRTTKKADADFMQFVFSGVTGDSWSLLSKERNEPGRSTCYIVRHIRHRFSSPFRKKSSCVGRVTKLEPQNVYCFTVPTGLLLLRRKNYIFVTGNSPWTKDGTKADLTLNLLARERALDYVQSHPETDVVYCSIACRIGSPRILCVLTDAVGNTLQSGYENITPAELIRHFRLDEPQFARMCMYGLFS